MRGKRIAQTGVIAALGFGGCRAVLGIEDSNVVDVGSDASIEANHPDGDAETSVAFPDQKVDAEAAVAIDAECDASLDTSENCGTCGHDCRGGKCLAGKCQPFLLEGTSSNYMLPALAPAYVYVSSLPGPVYRIDRVTGQVEEANLANLGAYTVRAHGGFVYFADYQGARILRTPDSGIFALSTHVTTSPSFSVSDVFIDDEAIYFPDACVPGPERLWRANLDGSNVVPIATELPCISEVEVDQSDVWGASADDATLYRLPKSGLPVDAGYVASEVLTTNSGLRGSGLELDANHAYVSVANDPPAAVAGAGVYRVRKDGVGGPVLVVPDTILVSHMALAGKYLYWVDQRSTDQTNSTIGRLDTTQPNAEPEKVLEGLPVPIGLAVDGDVIYFTALGAGEYSRGIYRVVL